MEENQFTKCWKKLIIATGILSLVSFVISATLLVFTIGALNSNPNAKYARIVISKKYDKGQSLKKALEVEKPTLAFFYVDWCGYCKRFAPQFHKVTKDKKFKNDYAVAYINCDLPENSKIIEEYEIKGFPTVYLVKKDGAKTQIQTSDFYQKNFLDLLKNTK